MFDKIYNYLKDFYVPAERPALEFQIEQFSKSDELRGKKILDATPVFRNTLNKYLPLLAAGADLTVGYGVGVPFDREIIKLLNDWGVKTVPNGMFFDDYDFIFDCAGVNCDGIAEYGVSELTRTGFYHYEKLDHKVFLADSSKIKTIETALGTGDGFLRAMRKLGHGDLADKKIVIFGCGKVGYGVAMYCAENGAEVYAVDDWSKRKKYQNFYCIDRFDRKTTDDLLDAAYCVVSATGIKNALAENVDLQKLAGSAALIANIGVEDEFGDLIAPERVLNNKKPLNFILDEPTHLKFIDPTMALHNAGALVLYHDKSNEKFLIPSDELNDFYLKIVRRYGIINEELKMLEKYNMQD